MQYQPRMRVMLASMDTTDDERWYEGHHHPLRMSTVNDEASFAVGPVFVVAFDRVADSDDVAFGVASAIICVDKGVPN